MTSPRIDRLRDEIAAGTFETRKRLAGTVERLEPEIHGPAVLHEFAARGMRVQRAINAILAEPDDA